MLVVTRRLRLGGEGTERREMVFARRLLGDEEEVGEELQDQGTKGPLDVRFLPRNVGHQPQKTMKHFVPSNGPRIQWLNDGDCHHMVDILVKSNVPLVRISHLLAFIPRSWGS